jgi:hypothetical protein
LDEVAITRDSIGAHIKYKDPDYGETTLTIGSKVFEMSDQQIVDIYNDALKAEAEHARNFNYVSIEPPLGSAQIEFHQEADQWTPRGNVLRCLIMDGGGEDGREPVITVDNKELTWQEFGSLLCTYAGWGMRIEFTPEDSIHRRPALEVREPGE